MTEMRSHPSTGSKHVENKPSNMITKEENELVFRLLGNRCQTLATSVVQLYLSEAPDHRSWRKRECGVLCLVKDNQRRSYFFRLFCPLRRILIWEHEVYNNMDYKSPLPYLHTFEAEECMAAFNFASESEASVMQNALLEKLQNRKQKRIDRRSRPPSQPLAPLQHRDTANIQPPGPPLPNGLPESPSLSRGKEKSKNRREKENRKKITKADIGLPLDFRHVSHVGWDPNRGFDVDNVEDPQLKHFFAMAGVSDSQLQDRETREFIYDFINRHGGIDAVKEDLHATPSPPSGPSPLSSAPSMPPQLQGPPPPVPARFVNAPGMRTTAPPPPPQQPPPPVRTGPLPPPPPPPPLRTIPRADASQPPPASRGQAAGSPSVAPPPPPPPPPPPLEPPAPPPPPPPGPPGSDGGAPAPPLPPVSDAHSTLMDAIKSGKTLKHVEVDRRPSADSRGELLDQIRQGVELRSVSAVPRNDRPVSSVTVADSLAGALARALAERSRAIHSSSDSSSDGGEDGEDGDDDEEWED
ncbi:neural Wiskott-Aldrich syndrome protein-like [Ischnura elegans]|uniref:neural Wiskott-Aldrich syndrome protein-like n=1 Tax=Ischnura elegans TaxID=197161 RepID=UPI001ED87A61|nr:neural Wiskott-Aldrich syndrome protein-like [Ischnura elegans]